jgi:hypothetical protein
MAEALALAALASQSLYCLLRVSLSNSHLTRSIVVRPCMCVIRMDVQKRCAEGEQEPGGRRRKMDGEEDGSS